jgi:hypothetical protein
MVKRFLPNAGAKLKSKIIVIRIKTEGIAGNVERNEYKFEINLSNMLPCFRASIIQTYCLKFEIA